MEDAEGPVHLDPSQAQGEHIQPNLAGLDESTARLEPGEPEIDPLTLATSIWPDVAGWPYKRIYAAVLDPIPQPPTAPLISLFFPGRCFPPDEGDDVDLAESPWCLGAHEIRYLADNYSWYHEPQVYLGQVEGWQDFRERFVEQWHDFRVRHQGVPLNRAAACVAHMSRCLQHIGGTAIHDDDDLVLSSKEQWIRFWSPDMSDVREALLWMFSLSIVPEDQSEPFKALHSEGAAAVGLVLETLTDMGLEPVLIWSNPVAIRHGCAQCNIRISNLEYNQTWFDVEDTQRHILCSTIENKLCDAQTLTDPVLTEFALSPPGFQQVHLDLGIAVRQFSRIAQLHTSKFCREVDSLQQPDPRVFLTCLLSTLRPHPSSPISELPAPLMSLIVTSAYTHAMSDWVRSHCIGTGSDLTGSSAACILAAYCHARPRAIPCRIKQISSYQSRRRIAPNVRDASEAVYWLEHWTVRNLASSTGLVLIDPQVGRRSVPHGYWPAIRCLPYTLGTNLLGSLEQKLLISVCSACSYKVYKKAHAVCVTCAYVCVRHANGRKI